MTFGVKKTFKIAFKAANKLTKIHIQELTTVLRLPLSYHKIKDCYWTARNSVIATIQQPLNNRKKHLKVTKETQIKNTFLSLRKIKVLF